MRVGLDGSLTGSLLCCNVRGGFDMVCLGSGRLQSVFEVMVLESAGAKICA